MSTGPGIRKVPNSSAISVGAELRDMRVAQGLSKKAFAATLGVSTKTLSRWERDELADVDRAQALRILRAGKSAA